jgi:hypothetical protein
MLAFGPASQGVELTLVIALLVFIFIAVLFVDATKQQRQRSRFPYQPLGFNQPRPDLADVGQQLHAVMAGSFERRRVLSSSEYRVFAIIEREIAAQRPGYRVFAQTSLGQILMSGNRDAFRSINSKRVDILVVDRGGWPCLAIEYQGDGHYQGTAAARDAVKKEALRKAGVRYIEFCATDTDDQIRSRLREHLVIKVSEQRNLVDCAAAN